LPKQSSWFLEAIFLVFKGLLPWPAAGQALRNARNDIKIQSKMSIKMTTKMPNQFQRFGATFLPA
jgi:hypothetical protein